jgi:hypothetical protein
MWGGLERSGTLSITSEILEYSLWRVESILILLGGMEEHQLISPTPYWTKKWIELEIQIAFLKKIGQ